MQENIKLIDLLIELTDARAPESGLNPDIDAMAQNKSRIVILNKSDMADPKATEEWAESFRERGYLCAAMDSRSNSGVKAIRPLIDQACREKIERDRKRGILNRPVRAMIAGIPNVGKSTFINSFAGKGVAKTGDKPGVTRGKQWIRINKQVELLDTPGILWPKFEDRLTGMRLAVLGSIRDELQDRTELAAWLIGWLTKEYPGALHERYQLDESAEDAIKTLEAVARARGCLRAGGEADMEKGAAALIEDYRSGRLGRISLEKRS